MRRRSRRPLTRSLRAPGFRAEKRGKDGGDGARDAERRRDGGVGGNPGRGARIRGDVGGKRGGQGAAEEPMGKKGEQCARSLTGGAALSERAGAGETRLGHARGAGQEAGPRGWKKETAGEGIRPAGFRGF